MTAWLRERRRDLAVAIGSRCWCSPQQPPTTVLAWRTAPPHGASTSHTLSILSYWDGAWYRTVADQAIS